MGLQATLFVTHTTISRHILSTTAAYVNYRVDGDRFPLLVIKDQVIRIIPLTRWIRNNIR